MAGIKWCRFFALLFLLVPPVSLWSQLTGLKHYGVKQGLPSTTVYTVAQDDRGFIWLGTEAGLVRFDGSEFKSYSTKDGLPDNEVLELCADSMGRIWITTYNRNLCFLKEGVIYTSKNDSLLKTLSSLGLKDFLGVIAGRAKRTWLFSKKLMRVTGNQLYKFPDFAKGEPIRWVEDLNDHNFNVYASSKVYQFINDSLVAVKLLNPHSQFNSSFGIWNKHLFILSGDSIRIFRHPDNLDYIFEKTIFIKGNTFSQNPMQSDNMFWVDNKLMVSAINRGIYLIEDPFGNNKINFTPNHSTSLFKDRDRNIWISTSDNGVFLYHPGNSKTIDHTTGYMDENTGCVCTGGAGEIWMGDGKGTIQNYKNGRIKQIFKNNEASQFSKSRKIVFLDKVVYFISDAGCFIYNTSKGKLATIPISTSCKSMIISAKRDEVIVGTSASLVFIDRQPPYKEVETFSKHRITALCEDSSGNLYCGSLDGLYVFQDSLRHVGDNDMLLKKRITCIALSNDNMLWIGTSSNGVIAYKDGKVIANISQESQEPFSGVMCRSIFIDSINNCWVATNNGLNKIEYSMVQGKFKVTNITPYFTQDGLADDDVNDVFVRDSLAYAATAKGVSVFNVYKASNKPAPPVYIIGVAINNIDTAVCPKYNLNCSQNNITIRFAGISFNYNSKIQYRYKLVGADNDWSFTRNNMVELKSLRNGSYTFIVEALDKFGNRTEKGASIFFVIAPPLYLRWWFLLLAGTIFTFTVYIVGRWRANIKQRNERALHNLNQKISRLEQQALRAQMNPHFIFNSLTAIQHFINAEDAEAANTYLLSFAKLIRKTLDNSESNVISVAREIEYLENYIHLEQMRFSNKFSFQITYSADVNQTRTFIPVMLTQPFVENAIRHGLRYKKGNDGKLLVSFTQQNGVIVCKIDDNGVGREESGLLKTDMHIEYQSKGIKISQDRIEALNNVNDKKIRVEIIDKKITGNISAGTLVILYFG